MLGLAPTSAAPLTPVTPSQPAIDMRHGAWPSQMIEQIEKLRDSADAGSTRIRVSPDALGSIDVSLHRHDSGAMQVALVADRPATQALIAEARPELTRLGEERGLRFDSPGNGGATLAGDGASSQGGANTGQRRTPAAESARPAREPAAAHTHTSDSAEGRVA